MQKLPTGGLAEAFRAKNRAERSLHVFCGMNEIAEALRQRARRFAVRLVKFLKQLPRDPVTIEIVRQLARSGPAVSANYRAACRGRSRREYIAKLGTVVEEADETEHWLLVLIESEIASGPEVEYLYDEACQLRAIFKASHDTARANDEQATR